MFNLPNSLSLFRILLIPVLILFYYLPIEHANIWASAIFAVASFTDWLDGYLARKWQQTSAFGAFIDPVADKLIVVVALVMILHHSPQWYILLPVLLIILREVTVSALREWMAEIGQRSSVKVSRMSKWKTTFQMLAIGCLIFKQPFFGVPIFDVGLVLLYFATWLTLQSMINYLQAAWPSLKDGT